jgi:tRNA(Arg) A34 adenosine deaminase TadA
LSTDKEFIERCNTLAESAVKAGNHPFGALLVIDGEVVLEAQNTVLTEQDVTCHAELNLVREAGKAFDQEQLGKAILYTSTEPCPMCTGAIYWAGLAKVVFGVSGADLGQIAGESFVWSSAELFDRGGRHVSVVGPIGATSGRQLHKDYWSRSRLKTPEPDQLNRPFSLQHATT